MELMTIMLMMMLWARTVQYDPPTVQYRLPSAENARGSYVPARGAIFKSCRLHGHAAKRTITNRES